LTGNTGGAFGKIGWSNLASIDDYVGVMQAKAAQRSGMFPS